MTLYLWHCTWHYTCNTCDTVPDIIPEIPETLYLTLYLILYWYYTYDTCDTVLNTIPMIPVKLYLTLCMWYMWHYTCDICDLCICLLHISTGFFIYPSVIRSDNHWGLFRDGKCFNPCLTLYHNNTIISFFCFFIPITANKSKNTFLYQISFCDIQWVLFRDEKCCNPCLTIYFKDTRAFLFLFFKLFYSLHS